MSEFDFQDEDYNDDDYESITCDRCNEWIGVIADAGMCSFICKDCYSEITGDI